MKKFSFRIALFGFLFVANLNAQTIQWQGRYTNMYSDVAYCIDQTSDGGYIVAGNRETNDNNVNDQNYWIIKLNANGGLEWEKILGGTRYDFVKSIQQTTDGGYIVAGESESSDGDITGNHGGYDGWIVKLNAAGTIEWQKAIGTSSYNGIQSIQQTSEGGFILAGATFQGSSSDYWIVKMNASGAIEWQKTYGGSEADSAYSIRQTTDGGYIVAGNTYSNDGNVSGNHGHYDFWILKLNSSGDLQWQKAYGGTNEDTPESIRQTSDGGYIITGLTWSNNGNVTGFHGVYDYWVVKLNANGVLEWQKALGGSKEDVAHSIIQTSDGGYIVVGDTISNNGDVTGFHNNLSNDYWDIWMVKMNATGMIQWKKALGGGVQDHAICIKKTTDDGFIIAGSTNSFDGDISITSGSGLDYWVVKFAPENLGVSNLEQAKMMLYPNPVKNELTVKLDFFVPSQKIIVSDILGKTILTQDAEDLINTINTSNLSKGTYFLTVQNEGKNVTEKFIVE